MPDVVMSRVWAMPNPSTFRIKPVRELVARYCVGVVCDPFVGDSPFRGRCEYTNDLDPLKEASVHLPADEFLRSIGPGVVDVLLYDPPYSPRQVSEVYRRLQMTVNMQTTQASFWRIIKQEIARVVKPGGVVISCGWSSGGIGKGLGFELLEVLLVPHGGRHNDTIVTVERKHG